MIREKIAGRRRIHERRVEGLDNVIKALDGVKTIEPGRRPAGKVDEELDEIGGRKGWFVKFYTTEGDSYDADYDYSGGSESLPQPRSMPLYWDAVRDAKKFSMLFSKRLRAEYSEMNIELTRDDPDAELLISPEVVGIVYTGDEWSNEPVAGYVNGRSIPKNELSKWKDGNVDESIEDDYDEQNYSVKFVTTDGEPYSVDYDRSGCPRSSYRIGAAAQLDAQKFSKKYTDELWKMYDGLNQNFRNGDDPSWNRSARQKVVGLVYDQWNSLVSGYMNGVDMKQDRLQQLNAKMSAKLDESYADRIAESMKHLW